MSDWYELIDGLPVPTPFPDRMQSAGARQIAWDRFGGVSISTVFLGLDHGWNSELPILFETMIFGGEHEAYQERYTNWLDAELGHGKAVLMVLDSLMKKTDL